MRVFPQRQLLKDLCRRIVEEKNTPPNKTPDHDMAFVKSHIESFPAVKFHYCRKNSHRKYLDSTLNLTKIYYLYKNRCTEENRHSVKIHIYRSIFNSEYNYGFHKPKKDICKVCDLYGKASPADTTAMSIKYEAHLQRKLQARQHKGNDKQRAIDLSQSVRSINFDLQKVLQIPQMKVSNLCSS